MKFDNSFRTLPAYFFERVRPTPIRNPFLIHVSNLSLDLDLGLSEQDLVAWLNGELLLPSEDRISSRYCGHQFGVWAGQLGDGRAISIGEIVNAKGRFEIQVKGSGLTPFSRMGDGKAVLRSSVREYLCSEAMRGLGIKTTNVLALVVGDDEVYREKIERSAIVARVFPSNLRFGHFELCYHFNKTMELEALIEYTKAYFFPGLSTEQMLREIVKRTGELIANWQNVGFCHGVMNTDNMSILGLTIDYGPFGFLEDTALNYVCNHSDHQGRYAYNQQPSVGMWNLERLLVCFMNYIPRDRLQEILNECPNYFESEYLRLSRLKMGLVEEDEGDYKLLVDALKLLSDLSIDYTFFWRTLCNFNISDMGSMDPIWEYYGQREELKRWLEQYAERLKREKRSDSSRSIEMKKNNPKYILKNYIAQEVIEDVEKNGREKLRIWTQILQNPFLEHEEFTRYSLPTPPKHKNYSVSCSS